MEVEIYSFAENRLDPGTGRPVDTGQRLRDTEPISWSRRHRPASKDLGD